MLCAALRLDNAEAFLGSPAPPEPDGLVVPLRAGDREVGYLVCKGWIGAEKREVLDIAASLIAVFIDRARVDRAKSDFVSIASHELRSPITVVHGIAATLDLRGDELHPDQVRYLRATLYEQTTRVLELVEQLLDLSQLDTEKPAVESVRFHPRERIEALLPHLVPDQLADISVEVKPELELDADPHAVERVLANLILNALRHGAPPVRIRDRRNHEFQLVVEDAGRGVDPPFVPQLFDRFTRSTATRGLGTLGTGLGLSIAHAYAEALGGRLLYEPVEPTGARFVLSLPRATLAA